jgi:methionine synthase reductase
MKILVTYGSQTGYCQGISKIIYDKINYFHNKQIKCLNDVNIDELYKNDINIILISTTGDGEFPENSTIFYKKIRKKKKLKKFNYILCGFGSSDYNNFCHASKCLRRWLKRYECVDLLEIDNINNEDDDEVKKRIEKITKYIQLEDQKRRKDIVTKILNIINIKF